MRIRHNGCVRSAMVVGVSCVAVAALALVGSGCSGEQSRYDAVKSDPTPNLDTLYQRPADIDNKVVVTFDENSRMFVQDLGRAFYWDRPSRLTREPIPQP